MVPVPWCHTSDAFIIRSLLFHVEGERTRLYNYIATTGSVSLRLCGGIDCNQNGMVGCWLVTSRQLLWLLRTNSRAFPFSSTISIASPAKLCSAELSVCPTKKGWVVVGLSVTPLQLMWLFRTDSSFVSFIFNHWHCFTSQNVLS